MNCTRTNFPYKSFYNSEDNEIYTFYRQGQYINLDADNVQNIEMDRMTDMDVGQMFLVYNKALVARCSQDIVFFKQEWSEQD